MYQLFNRINCFAHPKSGLLLLLAMLTSCTTPPQESPVNLVWPDPPAQPRIIYLKQIQGIGDLAQPKFFDKLSQIIIGQHDQVLYRPNSLAIGPDGQIAVTDQELQAVHLFNLKNGQHRLIDRVNKTYFTSPVGIIYRGSNLIVSDSAHKTVQEITQKGKLVRSYSPPEGFQRPTGLAYDPDSESLYVVDTIAHCIYVFDQQGKVIKKIGSAGTGVGMFNYPTHLCLDAQKKLYVTDSLNFRIQVFDPTGQFLFALGEPGDASGFLAVPKGVAVDQMGHIYVIDSYFSNIQIFDRQGRLLLNFGSPGNQLGEFQVPTGLVIDDQNRIYVCDSFNHRIQIFQYIGGDSDEGSSIQP